MRTAAYCLLALAITLPGAAPAADAQRGRVLYETRCIGCHADSVHGREKRQARDFESVRAWVRRWGANLRLAWTDEDVNDVAVHLNATYYGFACPPAHCTVTGGLGHAGARLALDAPSR